MARVSTYDPYGTGGYQAPQPSYAPPPQPPASYLQQATVGPVAGPGSGFSYGGGPGGINAPAPPQGINLKAGGPSAGGQAVGGSVFDLQGNYVGVPQTPTYQPAQPTQGMGPGTTTSAGAPMPQQPGNQQPNVIPVAGLAPSGFRSGAVTWGGYGQGTSGLFGPAQGGLIGSPTFPGYSAMGGAAGGGQQQAPLPGVSGQYGPPSTWQQYMQAGGTSNGWLPPNGVQMADGSVLYGTLGPGGAIQGQLRTADGQLQSGTFTMNGLGQITGAQVGGGFGSSGGTGDAALEEQRNLAFASLAEGANTFRRGLGQQTAQSLSDTMGGSLVPFDTATIARLQAKASDASAVTASNELDRARRFYAANGMQGAGGELAAGMNTERDHALRNQAARSDVESKAQLENFAARERARAESQGFLSAQAAGEAPYRLKEADLRSRFEVTGQSPYAGLFGPAGGTTPYSGASGGVVGGGAGSLGTGSPTQSGGLGTGGLGYASSNPTPAQIAALGGGGGVQYGLNAQGQTISTSYPGGQPINPQFGQQWPQQDGTIMVWDGQKWIRRY